MSTIERHRTLPDFLHIPSRFEVHGLDEVLVALSTSTARVSLRDLCMAVGDLVGLYVEAPRQHVLAASHQRQNPQLSFAGEWAWGIDGGGVTLTVSVDAPAHERRGDELIVDLDVHRPTSVTLTIGSESASIDVADFLDHLRAMDRASVVEFTSGRYSRWANPTRRAA